MYAIAFKPKETNTRLLYYSGKAGGDYLTTEIEEAFFGYSSEYARYKGRAMHNNSFPLAQLDPVVAKRVGDEVVLVDEDCKFIYFTESEGGLTD